MMYLLSLLENEIIFFVYLYINYLLSIKTYSYNIELHNLMKNVTNKFLNSVQKISSTKYNTLF